MEGGGISKILGFPRFPTSYRVRLGEKSEKEELMNKAILREGKNMEEDIATLFGWLEKAHLLVTSAKRLGLQTMKDINVITSPSIGMCFLFNEITVHQFLLVKIFSA